MMINLLYLLLILITTATKSSTHAKQTTVSANFEFTRPLGVYNSSKTPNDLPWNTYNYCNAPHVKIAHYNATKYDAELVHVIAVMRHHKRTPDNLYPEENSLNPFFGWDCTGISAQSYAEGTAQVYQETQIPAWHPYLQNIWNGTCDAGQLTASGLQDAIKHGKDFWSIYHEKLGFLTSVNPGEIHIRTTTSPRTQQVAGALLYGMDTSSAQHSWPVYSQPESIDSLVPSYPCPAANVIRNNYQSVPAWTDHLTQDADLKDRLDSILGTAGLGDWASWYDHFFDTFTSRTCNSHPLPCNSTGVCVSEDDAQRVYAIGDWEYNYIWNTAENATDYVRLTFGVMFYELAQNLKLLRDDGSDTHIPKVRLYIGHDGSMIRLAAGLGLGTQKPLRWPALGSEIIFEVWRMRVDSDNVLEKPSLFVRVMHEGTPVLQLDWVRLDDMIELLDAQVPARLYETCMAQ